MSHRLLDNQLTLNAKKNLRFHSRRSINSVSEQLEATLVSTEHTSRHGTRMETDSHTELRRVGSQRCFESLSYFPHLDHAFACKAGHDDSVVCLRIGEAGDGDIAIANCLDLEHLSRLGNLIKGVVDGFE